MSDIQPSVPGSNDLGRLSINSPLLANWPCRWCPEKLRRWVSAGTPTSIVVCPNCDQGKWTTV